TPSISISLGPNAVLTFILELLNSIDPARVNTISAFQFDARRAISFVIPRANPVNNTTSTTPMATPTTLMNVRNGRTRKLAKTSSSIFRISVGVEYLRAPLRIINKQTGENETDSDQFPIIECLGFLHIGIQVISLIKIGKDPVIGFE